MTKKSIGWKFDNTYQKLPNIMLSKIEPEKIAEPKLIIKNDDVSELLGLNFIGYNDNELALLFSGNNLPEGTETIAQAYAGHQFGHFNILGDGRALILGEHITPKNKRYDLQFKGSGKTPYSRNGDGKAALGPMLREYIISEAMFRLNIPTSRSLAVVITGEKIIREKELPGAILTRVAESHIRVGTFQFVAFQQDLKSLKILLDYTINRHYKELEKSLSPALSLLKTVMTKQIDLIINWMRVGFIHGVMNTDNMTISGETIDYGPCAFMDIYNPKTVFSSIDYSGRYAFNNQPIIAQWNLLRFAECLLPFIDEDQSKAIKIAEETINEFSEIFKKKWIKMMCNKLGLIREDEADEKLINDLLTLMYQNKLDYTSTFAELSELKIPKNISLKNWYDEWKKRLEDNKHNNDDIKKIMKENNPRIIPRNHNVEKVIEEAYSNNYESFKKLLEAIKNPYSKNEKFKDFELEPKKINDQYQTFCGT